MARAGGANAQAGAGAASGFADAIQAAEFFLKAVSGSKAIFERVDEIARVADRVGVGVESLQELRFAAKLEGLRPAAVDKALLGLSVGIARTLEKAGEFEGVLKRDGVALTDNEGRVRALEDVFLDSVEAIKNATSAQEALLLTEKAFGRENLAFVDAARIGREGFDLRRRDFRQLGLGIPEEEVREVGAVQDTITRVDSIIDTLLAHGTLTTGPAVNLTGTGAVEGVRMAVAAKRKFFGPRPPRPAEEQFLLKSVQMKRLQDLAGGGGFPNDKLRIAMESRARDISPSELVAQLIEQVSAELSALVAWIAEQRGAPTDFQDPAAQKFKAQAARDLTTTGVGQTASELEARAAAFERLRASLDPVFAAQQRLNQGEAQFQVLVAAGIVKESELQAALDRVFDAARKLNGFREQDIEELVGNSGSVPDGASISPSPESWE